MNYVFHFIKMLLGLAFMALIGLGFLTVVNLYNGRAPLAGITAAVANNTTTATVNTQKVSTAKVAK